MSDDTYKCSACGGVFEKGWSDEEAETEWGEVWGGDRPEDAALVCDDCFQRMQAAKPIAQFKAQLPKCKHGFAFAHTKGVTIPCPGPTDDLS